MWNEAGALAGSRGASERLFHILWGWAGGPGVRPSEPHLTQLGDIGHSSVLSATEDPQREALRKDSCLLEADLENSGSTVVGSSWHRVK